MIYFYSFACFERCCKYTGGSKSSVTVLYSVLFSGLLFGQLLVNTGYMGFIYLLKYVEEYSANKPFVNGLKIEKLTGN